MFWKYIVLDKNNQIQSGVLTYDFDIKMSEVCKLLEFNDYEVLYISKISFSQVAGFLFKNPIDKWREPIMATQG